MKKILTLALTVMLLFTMTACSSGDDSSGKLEHSDIDRIVKTKLMFEVPSSKFTYNISTVKEETNGYTVKGNGSLYDEYGTFEKNFKFDVEIDQDGHAKNCKVR